MNYTLQIQNQVLCTVFVKFTNVFLIGVPPFCPILSAIGTPTQKLVKFPLPLLEPLTYNQYAIKDLFFFCEELKQFNRNLIMPSFDVKSLSTNIPLQETIDLCVQKLYKDKNYMDGLSKDSFREMSTVTMTESFILFYNIISNMMEQQWVPKQDLLSLISSYVYKKFFGMKIYTSNL